MKTDLPAPLKDVSLGGQAGVFIAEGHDPQMLWVVKDRDDLNDRGAVSVTVSMTIMDGCAAEPYVYADWGDGFSDQTCKALSPAFDGVYHGVLYTNAGALRRLRFDPASGPCTFELTAFEVEPAAEAAHPVVQLSPSRRWARAGLRRLPPPTQTLLRRAAARAQSILGGQGADRIGRRTRPKAWKESYTRAFEVARNLRSPEFAAPPLAPPKRAPDAPRVLAFYLPQFHPIPENDAWWGPGFTEWSNVGKATPQFTGHLQPKLPADLGFYDLRVPEVRRRQAELARNFGVDGFCFHYYWFAGKRLLEQPLDAFVDDPELDFPFALCWANENWTRRWDGQESDVLIGQQHSPADDIAVLDDLARYFRSPRYIKVGDRPLLLVYRPDALPDAKATLVRWRARAREIGVGELFIACTNAFGFAAYAAAGFDALVEFPPHALVLGEITNAVELLNPGYAGRVYDYERVVSAKVEALQGPRDPRRLPGIMPSWDNEARKPGAGNVFHNAAPSLFYNWSRAALEAAHKANPGVGLVFVNAWNEWAEGAYLEPDRWFGHGFGQALRSAIEAGAPKLTATQGREERVLAPGPRPKAVILLHLYYADMIDEFAARLSGLEGQADLAITFPDIWSDVDAKRLAAAFPKARLTPTPNGGRDVAPFIDALRWAEQQGYEVFCKLHSKRSPHMAKGDAWRDALVSPILANAKTAIARLISDPKLGLVADADARRTLGEQGVMHNNAPTVARLSKLLGAPCNDDTAFPAGTMFWGRTAAFKTLTNADIAFEPELGRIDGTTAHALERMMAAVVTAAGFKVEWTLA